MLLCQTYINHLNLNDCKIAGYSMYHKSRTSDKRGGGVAILVDLSTFKQNQFESCFVELNLNPNKIIAGEIFESQTHQSKVL